MDYEQLMQALGVVVVGAPALLVTFLGGATLLRRKLGERTISRSTKVAVVAGLLPAVAVLVLMLAAGTRHVSIEVGDWVHIGSTGAEDEYHFSVKFVFDRLSVPLAILSYVLTGTIGAFASRYLHRERGFNRFYVLYAVFLLGMVMASLAGTIETLFTGWELVGLSSALLVAFFQERPAPSQNGLWVWVVYRVSDAALLLAAVLLHHMTGHGDFDHLLGVGRASPWPEGVAHATEAQALAVGLLLLVAAAGKSGLVPFSGWLPRAMEGPTPSSAVFYGALSVHLGAFLLLRVSPLLDRSVFLCVAVVALGLVTAVNAYLAGSVQTDIKSALAFASLSQVGIIVAEIGLGGALTALSSGPGAWGAPWLGEVGVGLRYLALVHLLGHACLRTLQLVRAPSLLQDYHQLENAIGQRLPQGVAFWERLGPRRACDWLYRLALERGYLDGFLSDYIVWPFVRAFRWFDAVERRWTDFLSGGASRESDQVPPHTVTIEELT
jgi:NAD(P)H-quinone oxidoreductase subunit 5